jgi:LPXTG-motif cell wall-anchored protein
VTGARAGLYAMSGAGLLMLGVIIVVLARRRRRTASADGSAIME